MRARPICARCIAAALAPVLAVICCCPTALAQDRATPVPACGGAETARGTVQRVDDGRSFMLADGRQVRLAGVEVPGMAMPNEIGPPPGGAAAKETVEALIGGDEVVLRQAEAPADRYGRTLAYAYAVRDGSELFAQGELIAAGYARVSAHVGSRACALELLGRERAARKARLGLWANSYYEVLNAETPADILARQGRFALVEGKVVSVRESGSTIYVNFGQRWSEAFAVTILKRNERNFSAVGLDLKRLAGQRIRVRGFIEARGGDRGQSPRIEATYPEQVESAGE